LQIQIDEAVNNQVGTSVFRPRSEADETSAPKIVIKRQIGKKLDLSVGSTVGVGNNTQRGVNAEYKISPGFSIIGVFDTLEGGGTQSNLQNSSSSNSSTSRTSYGVDLKLQKRFK
jgi:hypothetical protein